MIIKKPYYKGVEILKEIPDISLLSLKNLLIEHPLFIGLTMVNNKCYGIIGTIEEEV